MTPDVLFAGNGEMATLMRAKDWAATPVGPVETWPASLKTTLRIMLNSRHPMFLWWGPQLIQFYNDGYTPSFGKGKHPLALGQPGRECWPEIWPIIGPQIEDVMLRGKPSWNEDQLVPIFRNGRIEDVYWTYGYSPVYVEDGSIGGTLVVCTENTSRIISERALRKSEERLRRVVEASGTGTWEFDLRTGVVTSDSAYLALIGVREGAPSSRDAILKSIHPDDRAQADRALAAAIDPKGDGRYFVELRTTSTPPRWIESRGRTTFDADGKALGLVGTTQDVTARKRIEAERERLLLEVQAARHRLRGLFEGAPAFVATMNGPEHVFEMANPPYQRLVGAGRPVVGLPLKDALPEVVGQGFLELLNRVYQRGEPFTGQETLVQLDRRGDGNPEDAFVTFVYQPKRNAAGMVDGIDVFGFDVTEQVRARQNAERLAGELRQRSDFEQQLIGIVSHDLRNPVSAILFGAAALLRTEELTDRQTKSLVRIQTSADRASRMIRDLLDFTQMRLGGGIRIERRPTDLHELLRAVLDEVEAAYPGREVEVLREGDGHGDWDPDRLAQVLQNLITNALKYSPEGSPIVIRTWSRDGSVDVAIHNEGVQIPPELLGKIFHPLERATSEVDKTGRSIGLGLYIVKQVVDAHGGTVGVESTADGTTFTVGLPRKPH